MRTGCPSDRPPHAAPYQPTPPPPVAGIQANERRVLSARAPPRLKRAIGSRRARGVQTLAQRLAHGRGHTRSIVIDLLDLRVDHRLIGHGYGRGGGLFKEKSGTRSTDGRPLARERPPGREAAENRGRSTEFLCCFARSVPDVPTFQCLPPADRIVLALESTESSRQSCCEELVGAATWLWQRGDGAASGARQRLRSPDQAWAPAGRDNRPWRGRSAG
jgi:hypothetical protein